MIYIDFADISFSFVGKDKRNYIYKDAYGDIAKFLIKENNAPPFQKKLKELEKKLGKPEITIKVSYMQFEARRDKRGYYVC